LLRSLFFIAFFVGNLVAQEPQIDAPATSSATARTTVQVLSWDFSTIGVSRTEYDRLAQVLADADISILQEVEFNGTGESALTSIARLLSKQMDEHICKGWFKSTSGERSRTAFIWRDKTVSYVDRGEVKENCNDNPVVIQIESKKLDPEQLFTATFYFKPKRQIFTLASIRWKKKPKKAEKEVNKIFSKLDDLVFPLILSGNFKMKGSDKAFKDANKLNFTTALPKITQQNLWIKNMSVVRSGVVDFNERFPELDDQERDAIAAHAPIGAEISFSPAEADALKLQLSKKAPARGAASVKPPRPVKMHKPLKPLDLNDDLEGEAALSERR
jgi:hypothetical protein